MAEEKKIVEVSENDLKEIKSINDNIGILIVKLGTLTYEIEKLIKDKEKTIEEVNNLKADFEKELNRLKKIYNIENDIEKIDFQNKRLYLR